MLKHIIFVCVITTAALTANPAFAFQSQNDTKICREQLTKFHQQASQVSMMLLNADISTHPRTGYLPHDVVFDKRVWLRGYSAEGSDAFYALPNNATAYDCRQLEAKLDKGMYWLAYYVANLSPERCSVYGICK
jgi:hypothetical protein